MHAVSKTTDSFGTSQEDRQKDTRRLGADPSGNSLPKSSHQKSSRSLSNPQDAESTLVFQEEGVADGVTELSRNTAFSEWPQFLTVDELRKVLPVGRTKLYELFKSGAIKCVRLGRTIIVSKHELMRLLECEN